MITIKNLSDLDQNNLDSLFNRFGDDFHDILVNTVIPIVSDVKNDGDSAIKKYTKKFDHVDLSSVMAEEEEFDSGFSALDKSVIKAFKTAKNNIEEFHSKQIHPDIAYTREDGSKLGMMYRPIENAAIYVPGGKAAYPSSILMGVIPAQLAGVKNITVITPPGADGKLSPIIGGICKLLNVSQVIKAGGAQGIAAAAFGTETVKKSNLVIGPGNIFVTAAKTYLFSLGAIQIDSMAGPSEVLIIADETAEPKWVAYDLLSQAEHEERAIAILLTTNSDFANKVNEEITKDIAKGQGRSEIKKRALKNCLIVICETIDEAIAFSNNYAPEHMELVVDNPMSYLDSVKNVGSLFLGTHSPVAVGDYISGTNHILPTGGAARFSSGVSVETFQHRMTWQNISQKALLSFADELSLMAKQEGFDDKHGGSVRARFEEKE
ncbi:MAG: histidinol dehydrogenase [Spirochaetes bacterium]|jgi:histidinol dehydrogenase|nr:histidinol dehydrogenase [Spirochaetota bacterium]